MCFFTKLRDVHVTFSNCPFKCFIYTHSKRNLRNQNVSFSPTEWSSPQVQVKKLRKSEIFPRQNVTLLCYNREQTKGSTAWFKDKHLIKNDSDTYDIISYTPDQHAGSYHCKITFEKENKCMVSKNRNIRTNKNKPRIEDAPTHVNNGSLLYLKCKTQNPEHKVFRWFKDNTLIQENETKFLKLKPFQFSDDGVYHCEASDLYRKYPEESNQVKMAAVGTFDLCKCPCPPRVKNLSLTDEELEERVIEIVKNLTLDRSNISSVVYKKRAMENSKRAGQLAKGITMFIFLIGFGTIVLLDGVVLIVHLYTVYIQPIFEKQRKRRISPGETIDNPDSEILKEKKDRL